MTALPISQASTAAPVFVAEQQPSTGGVGFWLGSVFIMSLWLMLVVLGPRMWRAGAALRAQMDDSLQALGAGGTSLLLREYVPMVGFLFGAWLVIVGVGLSDNPGAWNARISQWSSDIGVVLIALSVVLLGTIALFNRPRFLVMPHVRAHRGAVGEAVARLRRLSAREGQGRRQGG
jgi:hypothetical protein